MLHSDPASILSLGISPAFQGGNLKLLSAGSPVKKGSKAHIEGQFFRCWYYNPSFVKRNLEDSFDLVSIEGLCTLVPPSYIEKFAEKHPHTFELLKKKEEKLKGKWPWKCIGDYYIITMKKKD